VIVAKSPSTAWQILAGEAVIVSMETKVMRGLNPVGSLVWELIDGRRTVDEIVAVVVREFDVDPSTATEDVEAFVGDLLDKGLVIAPA
jgi:coenzyme PQQ synthesis protein D (PqqD)